MKEKEEIKERDQGEGRNAREEGNETKTDLQSISAVL